MFKKLGFLLQCLLFLIFSAFAQTTFASDGYLGMGLDGNWRPFADNSFWNMPLTTVPVREHPYSSQIMNTIMGTGSYTLRFHNTYLPTMHVVNSGLDISKYYFDSTSEIYHYTHGLSWPDPDANSNTITDVKYAWDPRMYPEQTSDGHMIMVDVKNPQQYIAVEVSRFHGISGTETVECSTFNIWNLNDTGIAKIRPLGAPRDNWRFAGGRGAGVPIIAGLIRPEELLVGEIRHKLTFSCTKNRCGAPLYRPAFRNDGKLPDMNQYPAEGMLFQLDPLKTEADFDAWGLNAYGKIVARALQKYGAVDVDNGGNDGEMVLILQNLFNPYLSLSNEVVWNILLSTQMPNPDFYNNIKKIPLSAFRVIDTDAMGEMLFYDHVEPELCP